MFTTNLKGLVLAYIKADILGAQLFWSHGNECPKKYNTIDVTLTCNCGVEEASDYLNAVIEETASELGVYKIFDSAEEFIKYLESLRESDENH